MPDRARGPAQIPCRAGDGSTRRSEDFGITMQVSFAAAGSRKAPVRVGDNHVARPLLLPGGARAVLGGEALANGLAQSIVPSPSTLFGPRGVCLAGESGPLFVCDTGHHWLLIWHDAPAVDQA